MQWHRHRHRHSTEQVRCVTSESGHTQRTHPTEFKYRYQIFASPRAHGLARTNPPCRLSSSERHLGHSQFQLEETINTGRPSPRIRRILWPGLSLPLPCVFFVLTSCTRALAVPTGEDFRYPIASSSSHPVTVVLPSRTCFTEPHQAIRSPN